MRSSPSMPSTSPTPRAATRGSASARRCAPSWRGARLAVLPQRRRHAVFYFSFCIHMYVCSTDATEPCRRLTNSLMMHGRNNGKKLLAVSLAPQDAIVAKRICGALTPPSFAGPHRQARVRHCQLVDRPKPHPGAGGRHHQQVRTLRTHRRHNSLRELNTDTDRQRWRGCTAGCSRRQQPGVCGGPAPAIGCRAPLSAGGGSVSRSSSSTDSVAAA